MKVVKWICVIAAFGYVALVIAFEVRIGISQRQHPSTLVITTFDADGTSHDRVVSRIENGGQLYVAANHWPRAWYKRALVNPKVNVSTQGDATAEYRAFPVAEDEHDRLIRESPLPLRFRVLTGFAPRAFLRLEPQADESA